VLSRDSVKPAAQQAAEAVGRELQPRERPCSTRAMVGSRAAAASRLVR